MNPLRTLEEWAEATLETSVTRLLGSRLQPIQLARSLATVLRRQRTATVDGFLAPNVYTIHLNPADFALFDSFQEALEQELGRFLDGEAARQSLRLLAPATVRLVATPGQHAGRVRVQAWVTTTPPTSPQPAAGQTVPPDLTHTQRLALTFSTPPAGTCLVAREGNLIFPVTQIVTRLGRSLDNDVILDDRRVSRHHARIEYLNGAFRLFDLGSANGTRLNETPVPTTSGTPLSPGDRLSLGGYDLTFRVGEQPEKSLATQIPGSTVNHSGSSRGDQTDDS